MPSPAVTARRVDGSMSLLADLVRDAQDPAYAQAAQRLGGDDRRAGRPGRSRSRVLLGVASLIAVGLATGVGVAAVRAAGGDAADVRAGLAREVQQRTAESDALAAQTDELRRDVAARRAAALADGARGRAEADRLAALELAAGTVPVSGPGVVVTLTDRPAGSGAAAPAPRGGQAGDGRVLDRDLQEVVNGLWAAGAEAVSIGDQRLTARTAIRSAGEAVLVDFRPLSSPYVVRAVGDPGRLEPAFVDSPVGRRLSTYTQLYGLGLEVHGEDALHLPAGTVPELRSATPGAS